MRRLLHSMFVLTFTLASSALAQAEDDTAEDTSLEGASTIAPEPRGPKARVPPPSTTGRVSAPGTQHTVERGDTLWDLSQRFLGSPWYWPKVWSYNPEIANPHWIYPGNEVRFFAAGEEVPTQVEAGTPDDDVSEGQFYEEVNVVGQIGYRPKLSQSVVVPGFITNRELEESGVIVGSFAETLGFSHFDHIYVRFEKKAPRLGEIYMVYQGGGEVIHPVTKASLGFMTRVLAEAKVVRIEKDNKTATVQIWKQHDEVHRGDFLGPIGEPILRQVAARPNERTIKDAIVVADVRIHPSQIGEHQLVIMDKGSDDGVKNGNVFTIFRQHDPSATEALLSPSILEEGLPIEDVGQCIAFDVKSRTTICLMSRSIRDILRGDHAEVRATNRSASR